MSAQQELDRLAAALGSALDGHAYAAIRGEECSDRWAAVRVGDAIVESRPFCSDTPEASCEAAVVELRAILRADCGAALNDERNALAASVEETAVTWGALTPAEQAAVSGFAAHVASAIRARRTP